MKHLVGQDFSIAEGRYRIVDVRRLGRDALVYAEPLAAPGDAITTGGERRALARAAFHYEDIADLLGGVPPPG